MHLGFVFVNAFRKFIGSGFPDRALPYPYWERLLFLLGKSKSLLYKFGAAMTIQS